VNGDPFDWIAEHFIAHEAMGLGDVVSDLSDHIADTTNPHSVTAAQVGAVLGYVQSATPAAPTGTDVGIAVDTDDGSISIGHSGTWYKVFG
jgi:hypothetical protein